MRVKGLKKLLGLLLAVTLVVPAVPVKTSAADSDSRRGGGYEAKESADIVSHENREGGLVGFEGEYAISETNEPVSVIVEFVHQPAGLVEAIADANDEEVDTSTKELKRLAEQDLEEFYKALEGVDYSVKYEYELGMNGVAVTVPQSYVDDIAEMDCVFAVYPDEVHENVLEPDTVYVENEATPGEDDQFVVGEAKSLSQDTVDEKDAVAEGDVSADDASADKDTTEDISSEGDVSEKSVSEDDASEESVTKEDAAEDNVPEEEALEEGISKEDVSGEDVSKEDTLEESAPKEDMSEESDSGKDVSEENNQKDDATVKDQAESKKAAPQKARSVRAAVTVTKDQCVQAMAESRNYLGIQDLGLTGKGVTVGVIDTGIDWKHPDLANSFSDKLPNGNPASADELLNGLFIGRNYIDNKNGSNNPMDDQGHGTHVAGTVAARGENTGNVSAVGIAPEATLVSYKVINAQDSCTTSDVNKAMEDAVADGCEIISMSLGWSRVNDATHSTNLMLNSLALNSPDVLFVVCAGNSGSNSYTIWSPGTSPAALTVANARIDSENRLLTLNRDGQTSKLRLIRSGWNDAVVEEEGRYTIGSMVSDADDNYKMVLLPTLDGKGLGSGTQEEFDAFFKDKNAEDYAGALFVVSRGQNFDDLVPRIQKNAGTGAVVVLNTESRKNDFENISWWQACYDNYLPVFTMQFDDGQEMIKGLNVGETYAFKFTDAEPLHSTASVDDGCYPAADTSIGPVKNTFDLKPDLAAPGTAIISTAWNQGSEDYEYAYVTMNGTSMATPHVSGIAALLREKYPNLSALELKSLLVNTADRTAFNDSVSRMAVGAGLVDPAAALAAVENGVTMTAPNAQAYTSAEKELVSNSVQTPTISLGVLNRGETESSIEVTVDNKGSASHTYSIGLENERYTANNSSTAAQAIQGIFSTSQSSITVPAGGSATFTLKATVSADAAVGAYETTVVLSDGSGRLSSPAAVYVYEMPKVDPIMDNPVDTEYTFIHSAALSSGEYMQLVNYGWHGSDRTFLQFRFKDPTVETWQPLLYTNDGELVGIINAEEKDTWDQWDWYYWDEIGSWYAPCTLDKDGNVSVTGDYTSIPEGAYKLAFLLKKTGTAYKVVNIADLYIDNTLPNISTGDGEEWCGAVEGDNVVFKGNIYDAGTKEMQDLGINSTVNVRVFDKTTDQRDNIVVAQIGDVYYRAEIDEAGNFEIKVPVDKVTDNAVVYYGDHFLPQGVEGKQSYFYEDFTPYDISYAVNTSVATVPFMNWYGYRAANMSSYNIELDVVAPEDAARTDLQNKIDAMKAEAAKTDIYTAESIAKLNEAIAAAEAVLKDESATLEELNAQLEIVTSAGNALELLPGAEPTPTDPTPANPTPTNPKPNEKPEQQDNNKPSQTGSKGNSNQATVDKAVDTGDHSPIGVYVIILGISICIIGGCLVYRRKRQANK